MSSRKQSQSKPYWKRATKQRPAYVREYAYDDSGAPVLEEGHHVVKNSDDTLEYDKTKHIYRDRPNRAFVRQYAAKLKKGINE
jgi:hypothetical protein